MEVTGAPRSQTDVERSCSRLGPKGSESRSFDPHNKCPVRAERVLPATVILSVFTGLCR